jgi:hypothetical protein
MQTVLSAEKIKNRLDCYGRFRRQDQICVARCALNVSCAIIKARYAKWRVNVDEEELFLKSPELDV